MNALQNNRQYINNCSQHLHLPSSFLSVDEGSKWIFGVFFNGKKISLLFILFSPSLAIFSNILHTHVPSFAELSKYVISPLDLHHYNALFAFTFLSDSLSTLFPTNTKGKEFGSLGPAYKRNSSFHFVILSNDLELVISNTRAQHSEPL